MNNEMIDRLNKIINGAEIGIYDHKVTVKPLISLLNL